MAESRRRKLAAEQRYPAHVLSERSGAIALPPADLSSVPGLLAALETLSALEPGRWTRTQFDLGRYERHLRAQVGRWPMSFDDIPPVKLEARQDRIWRFVALVFLVHAGLLDVWQEDNELMVVRHAIE